MLGEKKVNAVYKSTKKVYSQFTESDAPRTFRCEDCGQEILKGSSYYSRKLSYASGVEEVSVCHRCACSS
jgi:uncharacterized protein with PIN domain